MKSGLSEVAQYGRKLIALASLLAAAAPAFAQQVSLNGSYKVTRILAGVCGSAGFMTDVGFTAQNCLYNIKFLNWSCPDFWSAWLWVVRDRVSPV